MARHKGWYQEYATCPSCHGYIQASVKPTYRHGSHGWWIVECDCGHIFSHFLADGLQGAANATGGRILRVRRADEFSEESVVREVATLIQEKNET